MESQSQQKSEFLCSQCQKYYASRSSLCNHNNRIHSKNQNIRKNQDNVRENSVEKSETPTAQKYGCRYCDKIYNHKQNRWAHEKNCEGKKEKEKQIELEKNKETLKREVQVLKLENEIIRLQKNIQKLLQSKK